MKNYFEIFHIEFRLLIFMGEQEQEQEKYRIPLRWYLEILCLDVMHGRCLKFKG